MQRGHAEKSISPTGIEYQMSSGCTRTGRAAAAAVAAQRGRRGRRIETAALTVVSKLPRLSRRVLSSSWSRPALCALNRSPSSDSSSVRFNTSDANRSRAYGQQVAREDGVDQPSHHRVAPARMCHRG